MAKKTVVVDACVLYSASIRDLVVRLADIGLCHPKWSDHIHTEWISHLLLNRPDISLNSLNKTRQLMNDTIYGSLVQNYQSLIPQLQLPDENDCHVLAAAIASGADTIVTFNLDDFPEENLSPYSIHAEHPDQFLAEILDSNELKFCEILKVQRRALRRPQVSIDEMLTNLGAQGLRETVTRLSSLKEFL